MDSFKISLKAARVNADLTQDEVAKLLHRSKQTIVNWEKCPGKMKYVDIEKLASLYGIPIKYLKLS